MRRREKRLGSYVTPQQLGRDMETQHVEAELGRCAVWNIMNIMPLDACKPSLLLMFAGPEV